MKAMAVMQGAAVTSYLERLDQLRREHCPTCRLAPVPVPVPVQRPASA